jgi:hypothetical protein
VFKWAAASLRIRQVQVQIPRLFSVMSIAVKIFSFYNTGNMLSPLRSCCLGKKIAVYCENRPKHINTEKTNNVKLWKCLGSQNIVQHKPYPFIPISPIRGKYGVIERSSLVGTLYGHIREVLVSNLGRHNRCPD